MATPPLFSVFGRSPIRPLQKHMLAVLSCVEKLLPFLEAVKLQDWQLAEERQIEIARLENDADTLKSDLRSHLPKSLFLPVARTDLLELLSMQDRVANRAKDIAGLMLGRQMSLPKNITDDFFAFAERCVDAARQAQKAINELDELFETGFSGNEVSVIEDMIQKLSNIEYDTDTMQIALRKQLFAIEKDLPAVDVMFLYQIIEWMGDLADRAQNVGDRLEILLAR